MSTKKNFALRLDEQLMKAVEKWANDEFRSTNGQIEWIIHQALRQAGRLSQADRTEAQEGEGTPTPNDP